jgi:Zn-dependent protease
VNNPDRAPRTLPGRGLRVATIHRVPIYVSPFTLIIVVLFAGQFANLAQNRVYGAADSHTYALGVLAALLLMVSIVLHELGHALVAQGFKFDVEAITIYGFMGVTQFRPEPQTPARGFWVSVSGPLVNLVIGAAATVGYAYLDPHTSVGFVVFCVAWINLGLGVLNLLPGLPLDGGAAFASGVWKLTGDRSKATRAACYSGFVVAAALGVWGLQQFQSGGGAYTLFVAALVGLGAGSALKNSRVIEKVPTLVAGAIARPAVTVAANLPLAEALRQAQAQGVTAVIVADSSGTPWAVMNGAAADSVPPERRPWTTINQVSRPIEDGMRIPEGLAGQALMERLSHTPASEYVVEGPDGRPTGVLVMVDFVARLDPAAAARLAPRR